MFSKFVAYSNRLKILYVSDQGLIPHNISSHKAVLLNKKGFFQFSGGFSMFQTKTTITFQIQCNNISSILEKKILNVPLSYNNVIS